MPVPAEFLGRARLLRDKISVAHQTWLDAAVDLTAPLMPRGNFTPTFTKQSLRVTRARWRDLPEWGRLGIAAVNGGDELKIAETRLAPFAVTMPEWANDAELCVAIQLCALEMVLPAHFTTKIRAIAVVGLHGLARRFERGIDRSDKSVLRDLSVFGKSWSEAVRSPDGEFAIRASPAADGSVPSCTWKTSRSCASELS